MTTQPARTPVAAAHWNTLQILKASRVALIACDVLLLIALLTGTTVHRDAMKAIGKDSAPSIIAAQQIRSSLAAMDSDAANELLATGSAASAAATDYNRQETEASLALIGAAKNETYAAERAPLQSLELNLAAYERLVQQSQDFHGGGHADDVRYYRSAAILMDGTLLTAADDLDRANNVELDQAYKAHAFSSVAARAFMLMAGLVMLAALVWTQTFLSRRTRRTVNPLLLVATLLTVGLTLYALIAVSIEEHDLKVAKEDAFNSIYALSHARSMAYAADAEESRWLLDPAHASDYERAFTQDSTALVTLPASLSLETLLHREDSGEHVAGFSGYLADELHNITFPGEREAATQTLKTFEQYLAIDAQIRLLEREGHHAEAVKLCLGTSPGESDWAFAQFDAALKETLEINQKVFDEEVAAGFSGLDHMELKASIVAALIAVFSVLGLSARIREYT